MSLESAPLEWAVADVEPEVEARVVRGMPPLPPSLDAAVERHRGLLVRARVEGRLGGALGERGGGDGHAVVSGDVADPAAVECDEAAVDAAFEAVHAALSKRMGELVQLPILDRQVPAPALRRRLQAIHDDLEAADAPGGRA